MNANDRWLWTTFETFVVTDAPPEVLQAKLDPLPRKYAGATLEKFMDMTFDEYIKSGKKWELFVQPFTSIRLHSANIYNRINSTGNIKIVYVLIGVEVFIILLSCINFMNLSTAQYTRRIKESSLRKILGSDKKQLAFHFFSEAFIFCCVAAVVGFGITQIVIPGFNVLAGTELQLISISNPKIFVILGAVILIMSVLSGSYPAIFLSRFSPVDAMKGRLRTGKQGKQLRNGLVGFQFLISMVLIVSTIVVFEQIQYLAQKDIGFDRENLMVINRVEWVNDQETFKHALANVSGVEIASWCSSVPPYLWDGDQFRVEGASDKLSPLNFVKADEDYIPTLGLELKVGRNFSKDVPGDNERIILNENAVKTFGWLVDENVLGKKIEYPGGKSYEVVGVVRDFNYWALQSPIQPMAIFHKEGSMYSSGHKCVVLRVNGKDSEKLKSLIDDVEKNWKQFAGDHPFQYDFVDDGFDRAFSSVEKFSHGLTVFAGLAIMIACFGLLGMIIYTLEQRLKEIGIRKVVGASVTGIWLLVIRNYAYLIFIAIALSVPLCILLLGKWLEDFTYRINISPMPFVIAGGGTLLTSLLVTSYHVLKAAHTNPVDVLKDE
jgi:putative ABC transport system permease protein